MAMQARFSASILRLLVVSLGVLLVSFALSDHLAEFLLFSQPVIGDGATADVLIIGGSHAGLSAALTLARHQIDSLVLDSGAPRNRWETPVHTLPTWENRKPDDVRKASRKELTRTGFSRVVNAEVSNVRAPEPNEAYFEVSDSEGRAWRGRKLLLAMGVEFAFPDINGYEEVFPDLILHCLFTRGLEFKGSRSAGLLAMGLAGSPFHAAMLMEDAQKFAEEVTVYTNGNQKLGEEIRTSLSKRGHSGIKLDNRKFVNLTRDPVGIAGSGGISIQFEDEETQVQDFLVHQPYTRPNPHIVKQLGLETNERNDIVTRMPFYQTNVSGIFAAGDCASPFKMIANGIFQGSNAGAGIARELPRRLTGHAVHRLGSQKSDWMSVAGQWVLNIWGVNT